jgi:hypothetical protein
MKSAIWTPKDRRELLSGILNGMCNHAVFGDQAWLKGLGKTFSMVCLMWWAKAEFGDDIIIITNIKFGRVTRHVKDHLGTWHQETRFCMPEGIYFVAEFARMALLLAQIRKAPENRYRTILVVIDELTGFLNKKDYNTKEDNFISKFLDLSRKFRICLVGIGPNITHFGDTFMDSVSLYWYHEIEGYRRIERRYRLPDGFKLTEQNHVIIEGNVPGKGRLLMPMVVTGCPWAPVGKPRIGQIVFESDRPSSFVMMDGLIDKDMRKRFFGITGREDMDEEEMYVALENFLARLIEEEEQLFSADGLPQYELTKRAYFTLRKVHEIDDPVTIKLKKEEEEGEGFYQARRESIMDRELLSQLLDISPSTMKDWDRTIDKRKASA